MFAVLSGGRLSRAASRTSDPGFLACAQSEGILLLDGGRIRGDLSVEDFDALERNADEG
jgi:hypothetical protein